MAAAGAGQCRQVSEQVLHAGGGIGDELQVADGGGGEIANEILCGQLREIGDGAERFLQIVTGEVGEFIEFEIEAAQAFVGPFQRCGGAREFPFRSSAPGEVAGDRSATRGVVEVEEG